MGPKMKYLQVLIVTLVLRIPLYVSQDAASFFVVTKNHCITNRESAIVFNPDINNVNENEKIPSRFYPPTNYEYDCNIEEGEMCTREYTPTNWKLQNSISGNIDEEITDRRWEEFTLYKSNYLDRDGTTLIYKEALISITKDDYVIPLSLRLKNEGHIFLCEGLVINSNCYWIMLQAWNGDTSAIRRCEQNSISDQNEKWPQGTCKIRRVDFNHTDDIMSDKFWTHLKIIKKGDTIAVKISDQEILTFKDDQPFSPRRVFFHSKNNEGLWKFHNYTYIYINQEASLQLGPIFKFQMGSNCLALFAVMCEQCVLEIELVNGNQAVHKERFVTLNGKWKEFKIIFNLPYDQSLTLYYNTTFQDGRPPTNKFWAIDSIRQCRDKEYRILQTSADNVPCELVASNDILAVDKNEVVSDPNRDCSEDTFGENCLPCTLLARQYTCPSLKYCEVINNRKSCHCTAGFHTDTCSEECPVKYYGQGCKKHCKYCLKGCNNIDGICIDGRCSKGFSGKKCDTPPGPLLKYAPKVTDVKSTSCLAFMKKFEIIGDANEVEYFRFEHKKSTDTLWISGQEKSFRYQRGEKESITNLEADTEYCVRAVLYKDNVNIYLGDAIEEKCFNTTCVEYEDWNIRIIPTNVTAAVTLHPVNKMECQLKNYRYSYDAQPERYMEETIILTNLKPAKSYKFNLRHIGSNTISKEFRTKEGVPSKVENLRNISASSNVISIEWSKPKEQNGNVTYIVMYRLSMKKDCRVTASSFYEMSTSSTYLSISKLKPYSVYEIRVSAQTSEAVGPYKSINVETVRSDTLSSSESSLIDEINPSIYSLNINFKHIKCVDIEGPIYLKFVVVCQDQWCTSQEHNHIIITFNISSTLYIVQNLIAYTNYKLTIAASRDRTDWSKIQTTDFTTKSTDPHKVGSIIVTSKDEQSISLRWKPPFPPTGILTQYKIKYNKNEMESDITPCRLWKDYHCVTITKNIKENKKYKIELYARNEGHNTYGSILDPPLQVTTQTEVPDSPYDFKKIWTDKNDLSVSWKHPNKTNGKVTNFTVNIANGESKSLPVEIGSEENYNLTYTYTIEKKNFSENPCKQYYVSVTVYNEKYFTKSKTIMVWSPPAVPNVSKSDIQITNDTNQNIFITLPMMDKSLPHKNNTYYILSTSSRDEESIRSDLKHFEAAVKKGSEPTFTHFKKHDNGSQENLTGEKTITINSTHHNDIYRLYIYFVNKCRDKVELQMVERNPFSLEPNDSNKGIYALILLIFLIPLIVYVYVYKIKKKQIAEGGIMSVIKPQRKKDIEEVPLSENDPVKVSATKPAPKQKVTLHTPASHVIKTKFSKPIKIIDFEIYVKRAIETGEMEKQHEKFPRGQTKPWDYGALKVNKSKNRYNNLIAYDHTRVKLAKISGVEYSDYINANYIDGYRIPKAYIATQGPKVTTVNDFWRMVWQEHVEHIVMLANIYEGGKKKVEKYWPSINEEMDFNGIHVQYLASKVYANYEHRVFKVHNKTEEREVNQLHFTSWPDHGVPLYSQSLVPFLQQMLKIPNNPQSPVVVHCSAGVGRTGTIILCDICLRMAAGEGSIDFLANLEHLRSQRPNMVDNVEQYKLAHLVVLECLFGMHTSIACDDSMAKAIENLLMGDGIKNQLRYLSDTEWEDRAMDTIWNKEDVTICPEKNRYKNILPDKNYRICLKYYPQNDELSSYINAVQVDGFRSPGRFIVSQQPLPNTVGDFWRMVWERQCTVIINLNEIDPNDQSSCSFWPEKKRPDMTPVDYLQVSYVKTEVLEAYRITTVEVVNKKESESMEVNIIAMHNWMPNVLLPNSIENFLLFWEECDISSRKCETIIVTCHDGATASGLYIAMTFLIDKIKLEQECDVCLAVRTIRHNRKQFITSEEQFTFLYKVALMYIQSFQSYANFA